MLALQESGITRRLVQFRVDDSEPLLYHNEPVYKDGIIVGRITSGMYGHTIGAALGMGYVSHEHDVPRNQVLDGSFEIEINGKRFPATASFRPFYDPDSNQVHL